MLIEALAILKSSGRPVSATIAGEGPDDAKLKAQAERLGLADQVRFVGFRPAREAFAMGRMLVIPSRAESLPYVVLEAAAAGVPIIATGSAASRRFSGRRADASHPADDIARAGRRDRARRSTIPAQLHRVAQQVTGPGARRILAEHHGGRRACRLSRSARDAKTRSIRITNF